MYLFDEFGVDNCKIELIELYPSNSREELLKQEGVHITNTENCINRCLAGRTKKEYYDDTRDHHLEKKKEHRLNNIEQYKEKDRQYRANNLDKIRLKKRETYQQNRENILEKTVNIMNNTVTR